jgi:hypothetical protein
MPNLFRGDVSRRQFLKGAGLGVASTAVAGSLSESATAQQPIQSPQVTPSGGISRNGELPPRIQFPPIEATTEQETEGSPTALPRERRLGFAIAGLGRLSLEEIAPAFGACKLAKTTALVSGDREKAEQVVQQYNIEPENIYSYRNYNNLRSNPDVDVIYIVLPNSIHAEYRVRGAQAGKCILCEKPMVNTICKVVR